jgi:predicted DNA-binding transcriptional regulator YafY
MDGLSARVSPTTRNGMAGIRSARRASETQAVTPERAARLYKLLRLLASGPQKRDTLTKRLKLDVRGFYRDLDLLHRTGITITLAEQHYSLEKAFNDAGDHLPFPDPRLTVGEARLLAKGKTKAHRKLQVQLKRIVK